MRSREKLTLILSSLRDRIATPSDVIAQTGLPRYEVLASFHVLEALGIISIVYSRGNYKLYRLTEVGRELLEALESGKSFTIKIVPLEESQGGELAIESATGMEVAEATA